MAIHRFVLRCMEGQSIPLFGDGSSSRDYTYVDDIVDGVELAADRCSGMATYNLGSGRPVALSEVVRVIGEAVGVEPWIEWLTAQPGDVPFTHADIGKAGAALGYQPHVRLEEGVERYVEWVRRSRTRRRPPVGYSGV